MRFEFYNDAVKNLPKLSVDGTVPNSIHFSHWEGNQTPVQLKADTSTGIALNLIGSPDPSVFTNNIELVTNNHFDTDGVLSVWTVLNGSKTLEYGDLLIAAAESGDFSEYSSEDGIKISLAIQGSEQGNPNEDSISPLAQHVAEADVRDDAHAYELVLPAIDDLVANIERYESLWRDGWAAIIKSIETFEKGTSRVTEVPGEISVISLDPDIFSGGGFNPTRHAAPYTAISRYARGSLYLIAITAADGTFYRVDYPYYSWAETVVRPRIPARDFSAALFELNEKEGNQNGRWQLDNQEMTSAIKFLDSHGSLAPSKLNLEEVAGLIMRQDVATTADQALSHSTAGEDALAPRS
ncbi:MAG: DUF6687 family protein [Pyrinomonadaceae bacterium]